MMRGSGLYTLLEAARREELLRAAAGERVRTSEPRVWRAVRLRGFGR